MQAVSAGNQQTRTQVRGGPRIFLRRGCTRLLLYFNTNKPHFFFLQSTSCIRKPQVISGGGGVCTPGTHPLYPHLQVPLALPSYIFTGRLVRSLTGSSLPQGSPPLAWSHFLAFTSHTKRCHRLKQSTQRY